MDIRIVAFDLDNTLLDSEKNVSVRDLNALEECAKRGIYTVPCTGRTALGIPEAVRSVPGIRYAITVNGGTIEDLCENTVLDRHLLDKETALEVIDLVKDRHVMYDAYINGIGISEDRFYNHLDEYISNEPIRKLVKKTRRVEPDIIDYVRQWDGQIEKVNMFFPDLDEREEIRRELNKRSDIIVTTSLYNNLEINAPGATKGAALLRLASILGVDPEQTMAFGDGENDLSLIRAAGFGVVMANGKEELKAIADHVTGSNDESGVAQAIEQFIL